MRTRPATVAVRALVAVVLMLGIGAPNRTRRRQDRLRSRVTQRAARAKS